MSGEIKELVLFDQVVPASASTTYGPIIHVDGSLVEVEAKASALGLNGTLTINGGNGKADALQPVLGLDATAEVDISAVDISSAVSARWRVLSAQKYVQVVIVQGATAGRVRVTGLVEVDQQ